MSFFFLRFTFWLLFLMSDVLHPTSETVTHNFCIMTLGKVKGQSQKGRRLWARSRPPETQTLQLLSRQTNPGGKSMTVFSLRLHTVLSASFPLQKAHNYNAAETPPPLRHLLSIQMRNKKPLSCLLYETLMIFTCTSIKLLSSTYFLRIQIVSKCFKIVYASFSLFLLNLSLHIC